MSDYLPPADTARLSTHLPLKAESSHSTDAQPVEDANVSIPIEDVTIPNAADAAEEIRLLRARIDHEAAIAEAVWSRSSEKQRGESDQDHQARIKRDFEAAVMAARRQADKPPSAPQPVPPAISAQTRKEMEAGAKQSAYWKEQQKLRPLPNAKEIQAAGSNTPVFRPGEFMHEKGSVDKHLVTTQLPGR